MKLRAVRDDCLFPRKHYGAATYQRLFDHWRTAGHAVVAVERYGHGDTTPTVDRRWRSMTRQLLDLIDAQSEPRLDLVGHSMGGYLSIIAAGLRPQRVRSVVLLDSPVIYGWKAGLVSMLKLSGQLHRLPPSSIAARRRDRWADLDEVHRHFVAKPQFARWHPQVLNDYTRHGTEVDPADAHGKARHLAFRRDVESRIYATVPHWLVPWTRRHPPGGPVAFVAGRHSQEVRQAGLGATRALTGGRISWIEGTHLFPFEKPDEAATEVLRWLADLATIAGCQGSARERSA